MQTLIVILFALAWLSFLLQISLNKQKRVAFAFALLVAVGLYLSYPYAIEQSYAKFREILLNVKWLSNLMVFQIIESLAGILFSIFLIRMFYNEKVQKVFRFFIYFPGIIIIPTIFYTQSFLFLNLTGFDFKTLAISIAIIIPLMLIALRLLIRYLVPEYDLRLELKFIVHIIQLILAIFISVKLFSLPTTQQKIQEFSIYQPFALLILLLIFGTIGIINYNRKLTKMTKKTNKL